MNPKQLKEILIWNVRACDVAAGAAPHTDQRGAMSCHRVQLQHLEDILGGAVHRGGVVAALASHSWAGEFHLDKLDSLVTEDINKFQRKR